MRLKPNLNILALPNPLSYHLLLYNLPWFLFHSYKSRAFPSQLLTTSIWTPGTSVQDKYQDRYTLQEADVRMGFDVQSSTRTKACERKGGKSQERLAELWDGWADLTL